MLAPNTNIEPDSTVLQPQNLSPLSNHMMHEQNGHNQHGARRSGTGINTITSSDDLNNTSFSSPHEDHHAIIASPNTPPNQTPAFIPPNIQIRWKAGYTANQQLYESREISHFPAWNWSSPTGADGTINMTDSGVDLSEPLQYQDANDECPTALNIQKVCKNPDQCEISPDMVKAMQHFSVPHICQYEHAKRVLVKKIVNKALQNAAPRIMALVEEDLQNREDAMQMEEDEEDMDEGFEAKL